MKEIVINFLESLLTYLKPQEEEPIEPKPEPENELQEDLWNNKWPKSNITYKAQGFNMDIRNMVLDKSRILEPVARRFTNKYDTRALDILKHVASRITYVSDKVNYDTNEFWQSPEITYQKRSGDCEDGALLIASLLILSGIPSYRVKVCAGWVKSGDGQGGHAYCIYLADDQEWYILDWCYWYSESVKNFLIKPHKEQTDKYYDIWFTFNNEYSWSQKNLVVDKNNKELTK